MPTIEETQSATRQRPGSASERPPGADVDPLDGAAPRSTEQEARNQQPAIGDKPMFTFEEIEPQNAVIKVIGVGGGGGNAVQHMVDKGLPGVEFVAMNTDLQALRALNVPTKLTIGSSVTKGLGAGANPEIGRQAALEETARIGELLDGSNMVFIAAGMGGGTGTGAAPVVAKLARERNMLTVAVVTRPFAHERRDAHADAGLDQLAEYVDSLITISNDKLKDADPTFTLLNAFAAANDVLFGAVEGIADLIVSHGVMNVDFADVQTVMSIKGTAMMGTGRASGENRARLAAEAAIDCPLLDDIDMRDARGVLLNVTAGSSFVLDEFYEISNMIDEIASDKATFIPGLVIDEAMEEEVKVTIVATGLADQVRGTARGPRSLRIDADGDYSGFDQPPSRRSFRDERHREPAQNAVADTNQEFLDLPTFLRRQAD